MMKTVVLAAYAALILFAVWQAYGPRIQTRWGQARRAAAEQYAAETARIQERRQRLRDGAFVGCRATCYG